MRFESEKTQHDDAAEMNSFKIFQFTGCALSYVDVMYVTQTVSTRTALARFLYITPPVTVIPPSYILAYQILTIKDDWKRHKNGVDKFWPYVAAAAAPAAIWASFRK